MRYPNYYAMQTFSISKSPRIGEVLPILTEDQQKALGKIDTWLQSHVPYFLLTGYAGTGKTFLTSILVDLVKQSAWNGIAITTPTHQAKLVLSNTLAKNGVNVTDSRIGISTVHSFLGLLETYDDDGNITFKPSGDMPPYAKSELDILIVDEASMVGKDLMEYIDEAQRVTDCHVIFVGDRMQIPPVNEDESMPFKLLYNKHIKFGLGDSTYNLETIVRQKEGNPIIDVAYDIRLRAQGKSPVKNYNLNLQAVHNDPRIQVCYSLEDDAIQELLSKPEVREEARYMKLIAYRNVFASQYNTYIRNKLYPEAKGIPYVVGDRLILHEPLLDESGKRILLPNNAEVVVMNASTEMDGGGDYQFTVWKLTVSCPEILGAGTTVVLTARPLDDPTYKEVVQILKDSAKAFPKGSQLAKSAWYDYFQFIKQYVKVTHSYAITCHKSQGSTYQWAIIDEQDVFSCSRPYEASRIAYTAITRAAVGVILLRPSTMIRRTRLLLEAENKEGGI